MINQYVIIVDGKYYCGEDELVSNPNKFNDPWSGKSFHTNRVNMSGMKFDSERENAKIIDGRMNLVSHVKRVMDYCILGEAQPNKIVIEKITDIETVRNVANDYVKSCVENMDSSLFSEVAK